jgi:hypothetical protein
MPKLTKQTVPDRATLSSPLASSAAALEGELRRYFDLATQAQRVPLNSEKNLERAARGIRDAMDSQERVSTNVRALFEAITQAREAQEASALALAKHAELMAARATELGELLHKFASLGEEAKALNAFIQQAIAYKQNPYAGEEGEKHIAEVLTRMDHCVASATELTALANEKDMLDIGRQADGIRQQVLAAKNKLGLLQKRS